MLAILYFIELSIGYPRNPKEEKGGWGGTDSIAQSGSGPPHAVAMLPGYEIDGRGPGSSAAFTAQAANRFSKVISPGVDVDLQPHVANGPGKQSNGEIKQAPFVYSARLPRAILLSETVQ